MAVKSYIGDEEVDAMYEDQYMKITVTNKNMTYDKEAYTITIQNKTEHTIVLADDVTGNEINLVTQKGNIAMEAEETWQNIYIKPQKKQTFTIGFTKFYDEGIKTTGIQFQKVRILRSYSGEKELAEKELEEAVALYNFTLPLN